MKDINEMMFNQRKTAKKKQASKTNNFRSSKAGTASNTD